MPKFAFDDRMLGVGYLRRAFATCAAVTADAELPQELRI